MKTGPGRELKFFDTQLSTPQVITTAWAAFNPSATTMIMTTAAGDGESNRDGRIYYIKSVTVKGWIVQDENVGLSVPAENAETRIVMFIDTMTQGAISNLSTLFDTSMVNDLNSFRNLQYTSQYKVLRNLRLVTHPKVMPDGDGTTFANSSARKPFTLHHTFRVPLKVTCLGTSNSIAHIMDNSIQLAIIGSNTSGDTLATYNARCRFYG